MPRVTVRSPDDHAMNTRFRRGGMATAFLNVR